MQPSPSHARQIDHLVITVRDLKAAAAEFERLGFTLTPKAEHPWGTSNRLVQFADQSFLEILTLDRPHLLFEHDPAAHPPVFSFGAYTRDFLSQGLEGIAMCAFSGNDSAADMARFRQSGLETYQPFDFGRKAQLPDGRVVDVGFSLAFARQGAAPHVVLFTCHNKFPENFWKAPYQRHANGAQGIGTLWCAAPAPEIVAAFFAGAIGAEIAADNDGLTVNAGRHGVRIAKPAVVAQMIGAHIVDQEPISISEPRLAGFTIHGTSSRDSVTVCGTQIVFA